jgi:hypothetical protein
MGHVTRETGWCVIDIDTSEGRVFLQERWQYTWLLAPGQPAWTVQEKRDYHRNVDRAIWAGWSNRATLSVTGDSDFARRFAGQGLPINLDIRWVTADAHWQVRVTKIAAGTWRQSSVQWTARVIDLDTEDFQVRTIATGPRIRDTQVPVAHEFGHAVGNTAVLGRGDEYKTTSPNNRDHSSMMHSGHRLRSRHFQTILDEMNRMIRGATFAVRSV